MTQCMGERSKTKEKLIDNWKNWLGQNFSSFTTHANNKYDMQPISFLPMREKVYNRSMKCNAKEATGKKPLRKNLLGFSQDRILRSIFFKVTRRNTRYVQLFERAMTVTDTWPNTHHIFIQRELPSLLTCSVLFSIPFQQESYSNLIQVHQDRTDLCFSQTKKHVISNDITVKNYLIRSKAVLDWFRYRWLYFSWWL